MPLFHSFFLPFINNCPRLFREKRQFPLYYQYFWHNHHVRVVVGVGGTDERIHALPIIRMLDARMLGYYETNRPGRNM